MRVDANPSANGHFPNLPGAEPPHSATADRSKRSSGTDSLTLSPESRALAADTQTGSPAHRARSLVQTYDELGHLPFGRIVSALARGDDPVAKYVTPAGADNASAPAVADDSGPATGTEETGTASGDSFIDGTTAAPASDDGPLHNDAETTLSAFSAQW